MQYSQQFHTSLIPDEINAYLERGWKTVWIAKSPHSGYDVIFEVAAPEPLLDAAAIVDGFLVQVNPGTMDRAIAENADMGTSVSEAAITYLRGLVRSRLDGS